MNALCYKIVFSKRLGSLVVVGEHTSGQGKAAGTGVRAGVFPEGAGTAGHGASGNFVGLLKSVFASVAISCVTTGLATAAGPAVNTLPTGYSVNSGNVAISSTSSATNAAMTIQQTTDKASINWQSFSIGSGAAVNVVQNSASSVLLNRVVGNDPSQIFGKLTANGQVILINPNGIVFGKGGSVTASAFTASTFGMTDADFLAGKHKFSRNGSTAGVTVENGATINTTTPGGYVALIGASVDNQGAITTKEGAVVLAAGESVALPAAMTDSVGIPLSSKVRLELAPSTINASVENGGTITTEGGQVLMQAAAVADAVASVTHTGTIDTTGEQGGAVTLQTDHGIIKVTGTIKANSKNAKNKGGDIIIGRDDKVDPVTKKTITVLAKSTDVSGAQLESQGGFVETSGEFLKVDDISIKAKDWLLDPTNIRIVTTLPTATQLTPSDGPKSTGETQTFKDTNTAVNESRIQNTTINTALNSGVNVIISTGLRGISGDVGTQDGNIIVDANGATPTISKTIGGNAKLTLIANNSITLNGGISGTSTAGTLDVEMTANGNTLNPANSQGITVNRAITTNGEITLTAIINNPSTNTEAIRFNNTTISARKYKISGTHNNTATESHGIVFNGTNTFTATEDSSVRGVTRGGSWPPSMGVYYRNSSNTTFNSGSGHTTVVGVLSGTGSAGTRISYDSGANITTNSSGTGSVTLGSNETGASFFHRKGVIKAATGTLNILGTSITTYEPNAIIQGDNGSTINLRANSIEFGTTAGGSSVIRPSAINGGFNLNIATDRLVVRPGSTTSSGTGTTTIQGFSNGTQIDLGGDDATGKLGITNAELNSFTAGNLVVGNSANTGGVTVSGPITTLASTGNLRLRTGSNITLNAALTAGDNPATPVVESNRHLTLAAGGAITSGASGKLTATDLTLEAGSTIGAVGAAIKTNVTTANLTSAGHQFLVEDNNVSVTAKTTDNGNINITTTNGTMKVETVNGVSGIDAGTGNVGLTATSGSGHAIVMSSNVKGKDITVDATANNGTGLGFYGAGGSFTASGTLNLTGTATGTGNGFYSFGGTHSAQTGINITGTSANGQGVGFDRNVVLTNASNDIVIKGTSNGTGTNPEAIGLRGSSITNTNGDIKLVAVKGNVITNSEGGTPGQYWGLPGPLTNTITNNGTGEIQVLAGTTATDTGAIDGKVLNITQNGNGGVLIKTTGNGNVTTPKITNAGTGNVTVAAGALKDAGDGNQGQVLTVIGNSVTQQGTGETYIYTGSATGTGDLNNLMGSLATLYLSKVGNESQNAQLNTAYSNGTSAITSGAKAQVMFREDTRFDAIAINPATLTKTVGQSDPSNAAFAAALAAANPEGASLSFNSPTANNFKISTDAAGITGNLPSPSNQARTVGTYNYENLKTSGIATTVRSTNSGSPAAKLVVQSTNIIPVPTPVTPNANTAKVKVPVGSTNPFALASAEDLADDICSANSIENCHCEESAVSQGVDICYEPKAGGKGAAR